MCQKITAQPAFTRRWNDAAQHGKIASIIDLPIFCANNEHRSLILRTTIQRDGIQATDLLWFILVDGVRVFVFIAQQCPHFDGTGGCYGKHHIILTLWRPKHLKKAKPKITLQFGVIGELLNLHVVRISNRVWLLNLTRR